MSRLTLICATLVLTAIVGCSDSSDSQPLQPLLSRYILSSDDSVPEGIAFDPVERAFYVTSLQGASIVRVAADGEESIFRPADNRALIGGAKIDADARRLWVCAQQVDGMDSRVWVYDLTSEELTNDFLLGALTTNASCYDLVLDADGVAYVTDP